MSSSSGPGSRVHVCPESDSLRHACQSRQMVRVKPVTQAWAEALVLGDDVFAERFGTAVEPGWGEGFPEVMAFLAEVPNATTPGEWGLHLVFDEEGALVGNAGWKGEPVDGAAPLGYAVAPSRRGRGIATAVVRGATHSGSGPSCENGGRPHPGRVIIVHVSAGALRVRQRGRGARSRRWSDLALGAFPSRAVAPPGRLCPSQMTAPIEPVRIPAPTPATPQRRRVARPIIGDPSMACCLRTWARSHPRAVIPPPCSAGSAVERMRASIRLSAGRALG